MFIVVGGIIVFMMDNPVVIIAIIAVVLLVILVYSLIRKNNSNPISKTSQEPKISNNTSMNNYNNDITSISDFQKELQQNTKTPQQVQTIKDIEETNKIYDYAKSTYETIKRELINQAQSGNYTLISDNKVITYDYEYRHKPQFIGQKKNMFILTKHFLILVVSMQINKTKMKFIHYHLLYKDLELVNFIINLF